MWSIQPYLTLGIEYAYGMRENKDGSDLDKNRIGIGIRLLGAVADVIDARWTFVQIFITRALI